MFIQITPEGYTPDGKYRLVPVQPTELMQDCMSMSRFNFDVAVDAAPPPPAEMLVDDRMGAMKTELAFLEDWLYYADDPVGIEYDGGGEPWPVYRTLRELTEAMSGRHRELSEKLTAAIDAARGK